MHTLHKAHTGSYEVYFGLTLCMGLVYGGLIYLTLNLLEGNVNLKKYSYIL